MTTPLANIPEILANQNNKYLVHNEAIRTLETLGIGSAIALQSDPPVNQSNGDVYIVAAAATGVWEGLDNKLVQYQDTGWLVFNVPFGFSIYDRNTQEFQIWNGATWNIYNRLQYAATPVDAKKKWIDDLPIYTQVFTYSDIPLGDWHTVGSILGVSTWTNLIGQFNDGVVLFGNQITADGSADISYRINGDDVQIAVSNNRSTTNSGFVIVEYTLV